MACDKLVLPDGTRVILCSRQRKRRCSVCGQLGATQLCDGRPPGKKGTCDKPLCVGCAKAAPGDKDYCPSCSTSPAAQQRQLPLLGEVE